MASPERVSDRPAAPDVETIIDSDAALLVYRHQEAIVHHTFRRFVHGPQFREVLEVGLDLFKKRGACKWLSDDRRNGAITAADGTWALNDWAPRVIAAGWKYWAVVMPRKVLGQMNMRRWAETYGKQGVIAQLFDDPDDALGWLEKP